MSANNQNADTARLVRKANRWREQYNPLRGLIMARVVALLEAGERGEMASIQWLYRFVEKRYPVLRSLVARRRSALQKLEWQVKTIEVEEYFPKEEKGEGASDQLSVVSDQSPPSVAKAMEGVLPADGKTEGGGSSWNPRLKGMTKEQVKCLAEKQAAFLRGRYELLENLQDAIAALALAEFRGFAMLAKHRFEDGDNKGAIQELHWLPQWCIVRDGLFGEYFWNPEARDTSAMALGAGALIDRAEVMVREVEMPINEIGLIAFLRANLSQKDWDGFLEIVGIPGGVVTMPPNIPPGKEDEYESAATAVAEGGNGVIPNGASISFPTASFRGQAPFREHLEWQEKDVVLAGTGGKLTMLTGPTGLGGGQSEVHQDAFDEIATDEARQISEIFQKQFDIPELAAAFPGQPVLAYWELAAEDQGEQERLKFSREVWQGFQADGTVADVMANLTDLKELTREAGLPVQQDYVEPWLPVANEQGQAITGEVVRDGEGDIVGGKAEGGNLKPEMGDGGQGAEGRGQRTEDSGQGTGKGETGKRGDGDGTGGVGNETGKRGNGETGISNRMIGDAQERIPTGETAMMGVVARAAAADLAPWRERLTAVLAIEDPAIMQAKLRGLISEIEQLKKDISADPEMAKAVEAVIAQGLVEGMGAGKAEGKAKG